MRLQLLLFVAVSPLLLGFAEKTTGEPRGHDDGQVLDQHLGTLTGAECVAAEDLKNHEVGIKSTGVDGGVEAVLKKGNKLIKVRHMAITSVATEPHFWWLKTKTWYGWQVTLLCQVDRQLPKDEACPADKYAVLVQVKTGKKMKGAAKFVNGVKPVGNNKRSDEVYLLISAPGRSSRGLRLPDGFDYPRS
eukprot:Lankesteria_metandrocarpae@DN3500_c0_g1_i1.p1